jgi:hypothetical protein
VSVTVEGPPPSSAEEKMSLAAGPGKGVPAGRGMPLGAGECGDCFSTSDKCHLLVCWGLC